MIYLDIEDYYRARGLFARAAEGPRMPLAILRLPAGNWPASFQLDDSQAMSPELKLSGFAQVVVQARVSRSGQALPQSGDLIGQTAALKPGTRKRPAEQVRGIQIVFQNPDSALNRRHSVRRIIGRLVSFPRKRNADPVAIWMEALSAARLGLRDPDDVESVYDGDVAGFAEVAARPGACCSSTTSVLRALCSRTKAAPARPRTASLLPRTSR